MTKGQKATERSKRIAQEKRVALKAKLGAKCALCGKTEPEVKLEFDHIQKRTWNMRAYNQAQRMRIMEKEAEQGLIQLACRSCNAQKQ